jgi:hypothetical protein
MAFVWLLLALLLPFTFSFSASVREGLSGHRTGRILVPVTELSALLR